MTNYYQLLEVSEHAPAREIKKAFREKAKRLHPDIAGEGAAAEMRKLLSAYEILIDGNRRFEYDRALSRFVNKYIKKQGFDYRSFLRERKDDPESCAKLIFFELLHLEEDAAIAAWQEQGGLGFPMEKYLDREDWMDCTFLLAEELTKKNYFYEAFVLLVKLVREERRLPYFRHFMADIEIYLKEMVRLRLKSYVDEETWIDCLERIMALDFPAPEKLRWSHSLARALYEAGEYSRAEQVVQNSKRYGKIKPIKMLKARV